MIEYKDYDCEKWKIYLPILNSHTIISSVRSSTHIPYPKDGVFLYCPWCGKKREEIKETKDK